jgi:hypothetical protein
MAEGFNQMPSAGRSQENKEIEQRGWKSLEGICFAWGGVLGSNSAKEVRDAAKELVENPRYAKTFRRGSSTNVYYAPEIHGEIARALKESIRFQHKSEQIDERAEQLQRVSAGT